MPVPICTKAYLQAVQAFDIFVDIFGRGTLQEIRFVDFTEDMVKNIYKCFYHYWEENVPMQQANEDFDFAKEHCHAMKWNKSKENHSSQEVFDKETHSKTSAQVIQEIIHHTNLVNLQLEVVKEMSQSDHHSHLLDVQCSESAVSLPLYRYLI